MTIKLLLSGPNAAEALSVCEKTLWNHTEPRGTIPCVRMGARVLYAVSDLEAWVERQKGEGKQDSDETYRDPCDIDTFFPGTEGMTYRGEGLVSEDGPETDDQE